jgi:DNA repair exonuclease SbcCD nuclease subunit
MELLRFLVFSDPHITTKAEFSSPTEDGFTTYLHRVFASFNWIEQLIGEHSPDFVAMLGDLFETTGFVETTALKCATQACKSLAAFCKHKGTPLYWLVGNHDIYSPKHRVHNLEFLRLEPWGEVVDRPGKRVMMKGLPVFFQPWTDDPGSIEIPADTIIVLSHITIQGAILNSAKRSEEGFKIVDADDRYIFNGHHHTQETLDNRIYNIGSLLSRNFTDVDSGPKGATLVELGGYSVNATFLPNPYDVPFRDVRIENEKQALVWKERVESGTAGFDNAFIRVRYEEEFAEVAEQLACFTKGSRLEPIPRLNTVREEHISETFSPEDNFRQYVEDVFLFDEEGDRQRVLEAGLSYLAEVAQDKDRVHTRPIYFKRLRARDFQQLGEVDIDLSDQGLVWVEGVNQDDPADSNGAGKSTVPEAIYWCLTGKSLRGYTGDDVIRWGQSSCEVSLDLKIGSQDYTIIRSRKPGKVTLLQDGEEIDIRRSKDTDKVIAELIGRSKDVLQHSIFLTADLQTRFTALLYPDRVRLLEQITDAAIYSDVEQLVKKDTASTSSALAVSKGIVEKHNASLVRLNQRIQEINGQLIEIKREQETKLAELKQSLLFKMGRMQSLKFLKNELYARREQLTEEERIAYLAIDTATKAERKIWSDLMEFRGALKSKEAALDSGHRLAEHGCCPTCGTEGIGLAGTPLMKKLYLLAQEVDGLKQNESQIADKHSRLQSLVEKKTAEHEAVNSKLRALAAELKPVEQESQSIEFHITQIKQQMSEERSRGKETEARRDEIKISIGETGVELAKEEENVEKLTKDAYVLEWLTEAFSTKGIRARMLSTVTIPFLNAKLEQYSETMGLPCQLTSEVESKGGKTDNKIDVVFGGNRTYKGCSRGEKRRVDLAIQAAINDLSIATGGSKVNLLIADEVIDPLDEAGVSSFVEVLKQKTHVASVLLITHKPFVDTYATKRWRLIKSNGVTRIETEESVIQRSASRIATS